MCGVLLSHKARKSRVVINLEFVHQKLGRLIRHRCRPFLWSYGGENGDGAERQTVSRAGRCEAKDESQVGITGH